MGPEATVTQTVNCGAVSAGLYTLPACAIAPNGNLVNRAILTYVSNNQTITTTPSQSLSITVSYQISQGANPNEIDQLLFIASWTPQWPPPSGYYWGIYSSVPPAFPGTTGTVSFTLTSPSSPGTYYLWFGFSPDYGFAQAANDFKTPLIGTPGYIKIVVQSQFVTTPSCGAWNLNLYQLPACAIVPNTSSISRALLTSVSVQSVTVPPGQSLSFDVGYQISQGANPNEIDQLMFIASWTPSWPPPAGYYFGIYNSIPPSSPGTSGSASFSLTAPMTPGTYYLWFVWDANFGYSQAASDFTIPLSTPAHITIVVESGITTTMQSTTVTTISTSSVTIDGAMWNLVVTAYGAFPGYPKWGTGISTFGSGFYMDTPGGASLFIQRQFSVPTDSPNLSFTSWGNLDPVTVTISVNGETLATLEPPQTQKGGIPQTYQFSMSKWAGQTVTVRVSQISWGVTGTFGWYKNIAISTVKAWTFMVYMAADNTLAPYAESNLGQMRQIGASSSVNIIVLYDNQSSTDLLEIGQGSNASWRVRQDYPTGTSDLNMADPATLTTFIMWVTSHYPAEHYALILWDHSAGAAYPTSSFADLTSGKPLGMTWQDFKNSLVAAKTRFDVLGFDSCLEGMVEVASLIQKALVVKDVPQVAVANYLVASEETEPTNGWPYDIILAALISNPVMSGSEFASTIVSSYEARYQSDETWQSTTLSAIRIDQPGTPNSLDSLEYDVDQLGHALESNITIYRASISAALNQTDRYYIPPPSFGRRAGGGGVRLTSNATVSDYFDLYDFCSHLEEQISDPLIQGYCTNLKTDLSSAVLSYWADPRQHPNSHGLSIYIPPLIGSQTNATSYYLDPYDSLDFSLATGWNGFIRAYWNKFDFDITMSPAYGTALPGGNINFKVTVFLKGTNATGLPVSLSINMEASNTGLSYLFSNNSTSTIQVTPPSTVELTFLVPPSVPCATQYIFFLFGQSGQFTRPFVSYLNVVCASTATAVTAASTISTTQISYNLTAPVGLNQFTSNWSSLDGKVLGAPTLASSGTELFLFVRGVDSEVYYRDLNVSQWSSWNHLPGASTGSTPALAVFSGQLYVAVTAQRFTILVNSMSLTTGEWSGWRSLDGLTRDAPALATSQDGSVLYLLMRGIDNHVYYRTFAKNWSNWSPIPGPALALSAPSAVSYNNRLFVAVRGSWGSSNSAALLGNLSQSGLPIWSGWQQVGEGTVGPVSLSTDSSGVQQVLYVTMTMNNNLVYWRSFSYGGLFSTALQPILGVNATSAPSVAVLGGIMYRVVSCDQCAMSPYSQVFQQSQALARDASDVISLTTTETSNQVSDLTVVPVQSPIDSWSILGLTSFIMMFCLGRRRQRKLRSNY